MLIVRYTHFFQFNITGPLAHTRFPSLFLNLFIFTSATFHRNAFSTAGLEPKQVMHDQQLQCCGVTSKKVNAKLYSFTLRSAKYLTSNNRS